VSSAAKVAGTIWIDNNGVLPLSGLEIGARASEMSPEVSSEWNAHLRKLWVHQIGCTSPVIARKRKKKPQSTRIIVANKLL
jgi:hypothetical protein